MENLIVLITICVFVRYTMKRYKITETVVRHLDEVYGRKETLEKRG
tara:strand:+ start:614 stop:751 length:138 start_codon:yes stop_codon:yes gene_type:complete